MQTVVQRTLLQTGVQRRSTGSSTGTTEVGAFLRLPGRAATQQNAVLHGRFVACQAKQQCSKQQRTNAALHTGNQRRRPCLVIVATRAFAWRDAFLHTLPWRADDAARPELMALILMRHVGSGGPCAHAHLWAWCQIVPTEKKSECDSTNIHLKRKRIPKTKSCQMGR